MTTSIMSTSIWRQTGEVTNYDNFNYVNFNLAPNRLSFFQWNHCVITSATVSILYSLTVAVEQND